MPSRLRALLVVASAVAPPLVGFSCSTRGGSAPPADGSAYAAASSQPSPVPSLSTAPPASASASSSATGLASAPLDAGAPFVVPTCGAEANEVSVELPPDDAFMLTNAAPDASFDRNHSELLPRLHRRLPQLRCCYRKAREKREGLTGMLVFEVSIGEGGEVTGLSTRGERSTLRDPYLEECAGQVLRATAFTPSRKGLKTLAAFPLSFVPVASR